MESLQLLYFLSIKYNLDDNLHFLYFKSNAMRIRRDDLNRG